MLVDAWLKVVGAFTPEDMKLLKARGCASETFEFLDALDKLTVAWQRAELGQYINGIGMISGLGLDSCEMCCVRVRDKLWLFDRTK